MGTLLSLAPILTPLFGATGVLGGAWLVYRQGRWATDTTARTALAQADATARAAEAATHVQAMETVTAGFTALFTEQRQAHEQMASRVTALEGKVAHLEEEQRQDRRWKLVAVEYIRGLVQSIRGLGGTPPPPPVEIAADVLDDPAAR